MSSPTTRQPGRQAKRKKHVVAWIVGGIVALAIFVVVWIGVRGLQAKDALEGAIPLAGSLAQAIIDGDSEKAVSLSDEFRERVDNAASLTSNPIWRAAEIVPFAGPNLTAFRQAATVAQNVAHEAVEPLATTATGIDIASLRPVDGAVDLTVISGLREPVGRAAAALDDARADSTAIATDNVLGPVRSGVTQLMDAVDDAAESVDAVNRVVQLLPAMLGADGPRNYLLMFQNPAELRSTGGITGALALVATDGGRISLAKQGSSSDFPRFDPPVMQLPEETTALYEDITGRYIQNVTQTPHFPLSAELAQQMWLQQFGVEVDGVLSVDPVTLSYLLRATGPIMLPTGDELTADNAVSLLLSEVYARYPEPAMQDLFFAAAAAAVFERVSSGDLDPRALIEALTQAGEERRIQLWSADDDQQELIAETSLAGARPASSDEQKTFGVYLNDATGAKMDYYLDVDRSIEQAACRDDGLPSYLVTVTMTNTATADTTTTLPDYVTGGGEYGVAPGNVKTQVNVYGVPGMANNGVARDGAPIACRPALDEEFPVSQVFIELAPGESATLTFAFTGQEPFDGELNLVGTPALSLIPHETQRLTSPCDSGLV